MVLPIMQAMGRWVYDLFSAFGNFRRLVVVVVFSQRAAGMHRSPGLKILERLQPV
jgi:hypothetical protein